MPQNPLGVFDAGRGTKATLNVTTSGTVITPAVRVARISVLAAGSGALVINDAITTGGATTPNEVWNVGTAATASVNAILRSGGLIVSLMPVGGRIAISYE